MYIINIDLRIYAYNKMNILSENDLTLENTHMFDDLGITKSGIMFGSMLYPMSLLTLIISNNGALLIQNKTQSIVFEPDLTDYVIQPQKGHEKDKTPFEVYQQCDTITVIANDIKYGVKSWHESEIDIPMSSYIGTRFLMEGYLNGEIEQI